jgi:hypothetical protein
MTTDTQVLVVGAGPVGLFMAAELNRHGVSCRIVDKNDGPTHASRAASIQARTLEILDSVSLADEFVQAGNICHATVTYTSDHKLIKYLTFDELDSAFPFVLQLPQSQTERMVARYLMRLAQRWNGVLNSLPSSRTKTECAQRFSLPTADRKRPTSPISSPATAPTVRFATHSVSRFLVTIIPPIS